MFPYTYVKYTKDNPGWQLLLTIFDDIRDGKHYVTIPHPPFPRGEHMVVHKFCIYFWKGIKKDVAASWKG
jgi:hypothetical protein